MNNQMGDFNQNYNQFNKQNLNNNDETKKKIIISILGLAILIVAIIGISFAAYKLMIVTKNPNSISTDQVDVSFTESNSSINITNAMPTSDENGKTMEDNTFEFVVTTKAKSSIKVPYTISITTNDGNTLDDSFVKVYLVKDGEEIVNPTLVSNLAVYNERNNSKILYSNNSSNTKDGVKKEHYKLKVWVDESFDIGNNTSKSYGLKVNVDSNLNK